MVRTVVVTFPDQSRAVRHVGSPLQSKPLSGYPLKISRHMCVRCGERKFMVSTSRFCAAGAEDPRGVATR